MRFLCRKTSITILLLCIVVCMGCSKEKRQKKEEPSPEARAESTLSYISESISFGAFFDKECTRRTISVRGSKQVNLYVALDFPDSMQIAAVEFRLLLPEGVTIENDKYYDKRTLVLGTFDYGISEAFPCIQGPHFILHVLTLNVPAGLKNAEISFLPSVEGNFLGVAMCDEEHTMVSASGYKAVINPED